MVLLGDNYFVDRTAFQTKSIIERRMQIVQQNIQDLETEVKLLTQRNEGTRELRTSSTGTNEDGEAASPTPCFILLSPP